MSPKTQGVLWFVFQCLTVPLTLAIVRFGIEGINIFMLLFIQSCFSFLIILPFVFSRGLKHGLDDLKTKRFGLHFIRNIFGLAGVGCFYYGATVIPLNEATAISFTAPLFTTLAAALVLHEKIRKHRMLGLTIGFIGALIVIRPGTTMFNPNIIYILLTVFFMGFVQVFIAMLNKTETPQRIFFYITMLTVLMSAPLAAMHWVMPSWHNIFWLAIMSLIVYINVYCLIKAYKLAEIGTLMPFDFTRLIFTALIAYFIFGEALSPATLVGSVIILASIVYVLHKERKITTVLDAPRLDNN